MVLSRKYALSLLSLLLTTIAGGCTARDNSQYVPSEGSARSALEQALNAWKNGQAPGALSGSPPVQVVDSVWGSGKTLDAFEILQEEPPEGPRVFSVRLTVAGGEPQVVRYYVVGKSPLWVYREDDYKAPDGM